MLPDGDAAAPRPSDGPSTAQEAPSLEAYYQQKLNWRDCGDGFQCARLLVPLNYQDPDGKQLQLAVIRLPAADRDRRVGSLVVNPGGPGASGVDYARAARQTVTAGARERFDVVGFDPRGVGASRPAVRCLDADQMDAYLAADASPDDKDEEQELVAEGRDFAQGCEQRSGDLLPYVGTRDAARDMDVLRSALGDERLTYLGKSYGTYLGAHYADLFPKRVRALVLDGAMDPDLSGVQTYLTQAKGFEVALKAFVTDCVRHDDCPLGSGGVDKAIERLEDLVARTDRKPLRNQLGDGRETTQALAVLGIARALYSKDAWGYLRLGLQRASNGDGTLLLQLGDDLSGRRPDGTYTNQSEANMAVNCLDRPMPREVDEFREDAKKADSASPHFGEFVAWGALPCAFWLVRPSEQEQDLDAAGAAPILVVGTTRDPATPYGWAEALAKQLESGLLLTLDGDGHTAYASGSSCIDRAVDDYLVEGKPPESDTTCS
ncbi:MAG: alpha/beta fold hydrolase [Streptosporangiales bacterium]|nr:alpha/beta fold hydrolase [Streptosporangiales bacterium]